MIRGGRIPKTCVAQLGARAHYAVARILEAEDALSALHTDLAAVGPMWDVARRLGRWSGALGRAMGRVPAGVPTRKVFAHTLLGLRYHGKLRRAETVDAYLEATLWAGRRFCEAIGRRWTADSEAVYAFNTAAAELFSVAKQEGRKTILEQTIAPYRFEHRILSEERQRFPDWGERHAGAAMAERVAEREAREWREADLVVCGSEFVRASAAEAGFDVSRCRVVHYGVDGAVSEREERGGGRGLRVLTAGAVGLRKGSPYVLEAAKRLGRGFEFRMIGTVTASGEVLSELRRHVEVLGPVPRNTVSDQLQWADVFLLPSLCEGSAVSIFEALAHGLPVVCTPNCGSVVRDGIDGFVVPIRDGDAIAAALSRLAADTGLRRAMGESARDLYGRYTLDGYRAALTRCLAQEIGVI
jgi:glycosyltransferase involved in cell wall biosynthesis